MEGDQKIERTPVLEEVETTIKQYTELKETSFLNEQERYRISKIIMELRDFQALLIYNSEDINK